MPDGTRIHVTDTRALADQVARKVSAPFAVNDPRCGRDRHVRDCDCGWIPKMNPAPTNGASA
jgi:hypothetical protein